MPRLRLLAVALAFLAIGVGARAATVPAQAVVAYVFARDAVLQPGQINAQQLTRINYAFANIENGRIVTGYDHDAENFAYSGVTQEGESLADRARVGRRMAVVDQLLRHGAHRAEQGDFH